MNKHIAIMAALGILGLCRSSYGMATEQIGPDAAHPTVAQRDWPKGIVGIPRHMSRVYSIWVNGNENFYFKCKVDEINELLAIFAKTRMRDHVVRIETGIKKATTFGKEEIEYNVQLQIVAGIVLSFAREKMRDDLPLEPRLTILTGDNDGALVKQLKWPENLIVESEILGISINSANTKPKRDVYYGLCEFADGSPPVEFVKGVNSRITLWEQNEPNGINVGRIDNKGYIMLRLSDDELADLKKGKTWLTMTIGNWLVKAARTDTRFPADMLTKDKDKAQPIKVTTPSYYYGRLLFEDGSPPVLDPPPWPGAEIMLSFPYGGRADFESEGYFKLAMTTEQFEQLLKRKDRRNIYIPDLIRKGRSRAEFTFPANLLSPDRARAGAVKIPRPKLPRKELTAAESKIGKPIPGFGNIRFSQFKKDQTQVKPLLVCFWDMDQRPSRQYIRVLEKQRQVWRDKNVVVLAVHSGTKRGKQVTDWLRKNGPSLTAATIQGDPYDTLFAWGARSLPWLVLTDEKHVITKAGFSLSDVKER
jgi:hypothetical protein